MNTSSSDPLMKIPTYMYGAKIGPLPEGLLRRVSVEGDVRKLDEILKQAVEANAPIQDWDAVERQVLGAGSASPDSATPSPAPPVPNEPASAST